MYDAVVVGARSTRRARTGPATDAGAVRRAERRPAPDRGFFGVFAGIVPVQDFFGPPARAA
jgi:hypothetical protein